jgi:signal peptidase I
MGDAGKFLVNLAAVVVIAGVLARLFVVELVDVRDNGMAPTLIYGDRVLVWKHASVDMANVVVCEHPARSGELVIGRAVGFAGHTVHANDFSGVLMVDNDQTVTEDNGTARFYDVPRKRMYEMVLGQVSYLHQHDHEFFIERGEKFSMRPYSVEKGAYLLGDNRSESQYDSRAFGEVDPAHCLGQVFLRWQAAPASEGDDDLHHHRFDIIE